MLHAFLFLPFFFLWGFHGFGTLIVLLIVVAVLVNRRRADGSPWHPGLWHPADSRSAALSVLEQRYARGEIQRDEYLQKKHDLGG